MQAEVRFRGSAVGRLEWLPDAYGVRIDLDCAIPCDLLLRCYAAADGARPLLVGLPEPVGGRLRLTRHLSRETLKTAGYANQQPSDFYLSAGEEEEVGRQSVSQQDASEQAPPPDARQTERQLWTGDVVLDSLVERGELKAEAAEGTLCLRCPFAPDRPFLLAPAFGLCTVENGEAVLRWTKKDAAGKAASEEIT